MGIGLQLVEAMARESTYRPLRGDALMIGRQTVYYTPDEIRGMLHQHGLPQPQEDQIEIDRKTIDRLPAYRGRDLITDSCLMKLFGADRVLALDHSSYEGAEVVCDLRYPIPEALAEKADILIDGSTLDNVFSPSTVMQNFTRLLRPRGRLFTINAYSVFESAYIIAPPMWYVDYFVVNRFADCRVYVILYSEKGQNAFYVDLEKVRRLGRSMGFLAAPQVAAVLAFAEKGEATTYDKLPIQQHYRSKDDWDEYNRNLDAMLDSSRPQLARSHTAPLMSDVQNGYRFINNEFDIDEAAMARARECAA